MDGGGTMIIELILFFSSAAAWCMVGYLGLILGIMLDLATFSKGSDKFDSITRWKFFLSISLGPTIFIWPLILSIRFLIEFMFSGRLLAWLKEEIR